jgi:G:T-mismatch repair DNA endonuclease (very short patch repair protein)
MDTKKDGESPKDLYRLKRKIEREKRDIRKKALGIQDDHKDTSLQRNYGIATKTKRALKVEIFGSKSKSSNYGKETSIEIFVKEFLESQQIKFVEQKAISFINVDFFVPEKKLVIQCNGDYWHSHPILFPEPNQTQKKNLEKDKQTDEIIKKANLHLVKIWENDIETRPGVVKERLSQIMASIDDDEISTLLFVSSVDW